MELDLWRRRLEQLVGIPFTDGNRIELLHDGDEIFAGMLAAIRSAERTIDLVTFVWWRGDITDRFTAALAERAAAGVRVRILLDTFGSRSIRADQRRALRAAGAEIRWFRPIATSDARELTRVNRRTHRKILVCDETVGFTGGVGIAREWAEPMGGVPAWRDTHVRIEGPAVAGLHGGFVDNWMETGPLHLDEAFDRFPPQPEVGSVPIQVVRGAAEAGSNDIANLFEILLGEAEVSIRLTTAYFNPDDEVSAILVAAAARGVDVRVLVPGRHADKRFVRLVGEARYADLIEAGVEIASYDRTMLHAKILTVDGVLATLGSANVNQRSMQYDEELNIVVLDPALVERLDARFDEDRHHSTVIEPGEWADRSRLQKAAERAASVVSDLI